MKNKREEWILWDKSQKFITRYLTEREAEVENKKAPIGNLKWVKNPVQSKD